MKYKLAITCTLAFKVSLVFPVPQSTEFQMNLKNVIINLRETHLEGLIQIVLTSIVQMYSMHFWTISFIGVDQITSS